MPGQRVPIKASQAVTLVEVLIAFGLFTLLSLLLAAALRQSSKVWRSAAGQKDTGQKLRKVATTLEREFCMSSPTQIAIGTVPPSLGSGGYDGDAIWFLSHVNPIDGKSYIKSDGTPFWQCNVLYYLTVPQNVEQLTDYPIRSGSDADNYEDRCPHKVLIRKVIDIGPDTDPTNEDTAETLISDPSEYLTRPVLLNTSFMSGETDLISTEIVATDLLYFRAALVDPPKGIQFDIRATSLEEANRASTSTSESLLESIYTAQSLLFVAARN